MKTKYILLLAAAMYCINMHAQTPHKETDSKIQQVTVFFQGAQIERTTTSVNLPLGQTILEVKGLEQSLFENSVRAGIKGAGVIQTIVKKTDYLNLQESNEKITQLNEKLKGLDEQIEDEMMKLKVLGKESTFLTTNMKLGGQNTGVSVAQIKEGAVYYRTRLTEVETLILKGNRKIKILNEEKGKVNKQLSELNYKKNRPTSTLEISIEMEKAGTCSLLLDYYIPTARWQPLYDIRVEEVGKPVQLIRKASVVQSSGEDWNDVKLSFSTGNPQEKQVVPVLNPWYLNVYQPAPVYIRGLSKGGRGVSKQKQSAAPQMAMAMETIVDLDEYEMTGTAATTTTSSKNSILEFTLASKGSIPSDNKDYLFSIGAEEMEASYHYQAVPKLNKAAYLMATINDWEGFELVDGYANIYYAKTFIGETYLNTSMTLDSMQLSLGKDKGLVVERKSVKDFTRSKVVGPNVKKSYGYEIIVRNTKPIPVQLVLEDQYPISANSEISVDLEESGDGVADEASGKVTWRLELKSGETVKIPLKYTVKYPKDMSINL
jgi:uncharacterized protein (TIGR02231 family)